jgi:integral membrane protein (TIGR00529 family)
LYQARGATTRFVFPFFCEKEGFYGNFLKTDGIGEKERMSALLKITLILAAILIFIRFKVALSITLLSSALALGFLFNLSLPKIGLSFFKGAMDPETLLLTASLLLILFFSAIMKETGNMTRAIAALQEIFRDARATVAIIPAIIGILPIMGGAMLSAPLVLEASDELKLSAERRTFINYWFRHIWEYTLPTYPVIILISAIVSLPVGKISLMNLPLTIVSITVGIFLGFRGVHSISRSGGPLSIRQTSRILGSFIANLLPFFLILLLTLHFKIHLAYSLALATIGTILYYRLPPALIRRLGKESFSWEIIFLIWGIMIFKEILEASGAMNSVAKDFARMGMPPPVLIIALPFILGMITGYSNALVGLSFPILLPFFQANEHSLLYVMLAYASGFCAVLLSPMHACLVMTREYFHADMNKLYRMLILPVSIIFFTGVVVVLISLWLR